MRFKYIAVSIFICMTCFPLMAEEATPKKTYSIVYEEGKTPEALFHKSFEHFKKLIKTGELKSAELGTAKIFGEVIDIQTPTDSSTAAIHERGSVLFSVRKAIAATNVPYTGRFSIHSTNYLFGDKSLGYVINPYEGCYSHNYLAKGLERAGYTLVDANQLPDITMTIGIDTCMAENEFKAYIQNNTALRARKTNESVPNNQNGIGNNLIRSGSNMQLGTPSGGGNAGIAIAGVGLALDMANWLTKTSPQERDVIRYHVKLEGKDKKTLEFYPIIITKNTHEFEQPVHISAKNEAINLLYSSLLGWSLSDKDFAEKLPALLFEKDVFKTVELMIALKK